MSIVWGSIEVSELIYLFPEFSVVII
jgi:hypothetical protein